MLQSTTTNQMSAVAGGQTIGINVKYKGMIDCISKIATEEGPAGTQFFNIK